MTCETRMTGKRSEKTVVHIGQRTSLLMTSTKSKVKARSHGRFTQYLLTDKFD